MRGRSLFVFLRSEALPRLSYHCRPRRFDPATPIVRQGDRADTVHVIVAGRARVEQTTSGIAGRLILGELGTGEILCEHEVLTGRRYDVTIRAVTEVRTICVSRPELLRALLAVPGLPAALRSLAEARMEVGSEERVTAGPRPLAEVA